MPTEVPQTKATLGGVTLSRVSAPGGGGHGSAQSFCTCRDPDAEASEALRDTSDGKAIFTLCCHLRVFFTLYIVIMKNEGDFQSILSFKGVFHSTHIVI